MSPAAIHVAMSPATIRVVRPLCGSRLAAAAVASSTSAPAGAAAASHAVRRRAAAAVAAPRRRLSTATTATTTTATAKTNSEAEAGLSTLGTLFFGGLCASTFGLGCWQSVRYFEKMDQMQVRDDELKAPPVQLHRFTATIADSNTDGSGATKDKKRQQHEASFRRLFATGAFDHSREMLVGPRGPPPGALSSTGPRSGRSSGGMASSPQGYYVVTPLRVAGSSNNNNNSRGHSHTILVNRGWVPMSYVKQKNAGTWSRPNGIVKVVGVEASAEQPRFLSPVHDARTPNRLLWMDRGALEERTGTAGQHPLLLTETETVGAGAIDDGAAAVPGAPVPEQVPPPPPAPTFPVRPTAETVGEFKVTPFTHAGYAVTWYGLSAAGMVMTRKLLTRGRT